MSITFDFATLDPSRRYKLLAGLVVPRPIALITTRSIDGVVNAAPYSFFNVFSEEPAIVIVGLQAKPDRSLKDTTKNARATGEFVVNMVDEALARAMNDCAIDFPSDVGEPEALKLPLADGALVSVPHLADAPVALECRKITIMNFGLERDLLIGEVLAIQVREGIVDPATLRTNYDRYEPVGRIAGSLYTRTRDQFALQRDNFSTWKSRAGA